MCPFLINLNEIDFSEDYKTDFVIANTFLSSLNKKYLGYNFFEGLKVRISII